MNKYLFGAALGAVALLGLSILHAKAQEGPPPGVCPNTVSSEALKKTLIEKYHEGVTGAGIAKKDGKLAVILFQSENGKSWTLVMAQPDGHACIMAAGKDWGDVGQTTPAAPATKPEEDKFNIDPNNREADND